MTEKEAAVHMIRFWRAQIDGAIKRWRNGEMLPEEMKRIQFEYTLRIEAVQSVFKMATK